MSADGWVTIALLGKPRGNKGELQGVSLSDAPGRFENLSSVRLFRDEADLGERKVEQVWFHDGRLVMKFSGADSISAAEEMAFCEVRVPLAERAPLEPGQHYQTDLIGCTLIDAASSKPLGSVTAWREFGGPGLMEIDGDWLVPFAPAICKEIDVAGRRIVVELPDGLRELNRP